MLKSDRSRPLHRDHDAEREDAPGRLDLVGLVRLARRNRRPIGLTVAAAVALGLLYALTATPLYLAGSQLLIDARRTRVDPTGAGGATNLSLVELGMDPASVDSQVEVLRSERIALAVVRRLGLAADPAFTAPTALPGKLAAALGGGRGADGRAAGGDVVPADVVEAFSKRLDVRRVQQTYVIAVTFHDPSPERAAAVVNAVTAAYLDGQLQANSEAVRHTGAWLKRRIGEVREEAAAADLAVQRFKAEHGIVDTGTGPLVSEAQTTELSSALIKARAEAAQMQAREAQLRRVLASRDPASGLDASLGSEALNRLRDQRTDLARREAEIARRFGADHVIARNLRGEIADTDHLILDELRRVTAGAAGGLAVARAREASLDRSVADMGRAAAATNAAQVTLRGLERDFAGLKTLYEGLLARYNATLQQQSFPVSEARVLAEARPPARRSQPNTPLILALSAFGGLAAAVAAALLRELADRSFRLPHQVEAGLGVPFLGLLPALRARSRRGALDCLAARLRDRLGHRLATRRGGPRHAGDDARRAAASARFLETLRAVRAEVDERTYHDGARVVGVVSTFRGEGATTVATGLAGLVAAGGGRVLLVDAHPGADGAGPAEPAGAGLDGRRYERAAASDAAGFGRLLAWAEQAFDHVIVDLPPLAPAAELRAFAPRVNAFVLVLAWGRTDRDATGEAMRALPLVRDRLAGAVLNAVDLRAFRLAARGTADAFYAPEPDPPAARVCGTHAAGPAAPEFPAPDTAARAPA